MNLSPSNRCRNMLINVTTFTFSPPSVFISPGIEQRLNFLSVLQRPATTKGLKMWSNLEFKTWIEDTKALTLSQDQLKEEAVKFSPIFSNLNKKTVLKRVEDFLKIEKKMLSQASMLIFKEKGGTEGKMRGRNDVPPKCFFPKAFEISGLRCKVCDFKSSVKEELKVHIQSNHQDAIKKEFAKEVLVLAHQHKQYCEWLSQVNDFAKEAHECQKVCAEEHNKETTVLTRNLPSGQNIFETTTTKFALQKDGTTKK